MRKLIQAFLRSETGAIIVDWVVLTAAIIGLGIPILMMVGTGTNTLAELVGDAIADSQVGYTATE